MGQQNTTTTPRHIPSGAKGRDFDQAVKTPAFILEALRAYAPIDLDPFTCDRTAGHTAARYAYQWPASDALALPWTRRPTHSGSWHVFANPPFDRLGDVLAHIEGQAWAGTDSELSALLPIRSHRRYWRHVASASAVVELPAFAFEGHANAFPLPCGLFYWGLRPRSWAEALASLGTVTRIAPLHAPRSRAIVSAMTTQDPKTTPPPKVPPRRAANLAALDVLAMMAARGLTVGDALTLIGFDAEHHDGPDTIARQIARLIAALPLAGSTDAAKIAEPEPEPEPEPKAKPKPATRPAKRSPHIDTGSPRGRVESWIAGLQPGAVIGPSDARAQAGEPVGMPSIRRWLSQSHDLVRITDRPMRFERKRKGGAQ